MERTRTATAWAPPHMAWLALLVTIWALSSMYLVSDGAISVALDMPVLYVGGALAAMATLGFTIAGSMNRQGASPTRGRRWPGLVYAVAVMAVVPSLCRYGFPLKARLYLSRHALIEAARQTPRGLRSDLPRWIGLLHVTRVDTVGPATRFRTGACGLADECGVTYSPQGEPAGTRQDRYQNIAGPWWAHLIRR